MSIFSNPEVYTNPASYSTKDLILEYFPGESDEFVSDVLFAETGYPAFWNIPSDGDTPADCLRTQVARLAECLRTCATNTHGEFDLKMYAAREQG